MSEENINNFSTENESAVVINSEKNNSEKKNKIITKGKPNALVSEGKIPERGYSSSNTEEISNSSFNNSENSDLSSKEVSEEHSLKVSEEVSTNTESIGSKSKNNYGRRFSGKQKFSQTKKKTFNKGIKSNGKVSFKTTNKNPNTSQKILSEEGVIPIDRNFVLKETLSLEALKTIESLKTYRETISNKELEPIDFNAIYNLSIPELKVLAKESGQDLLSNNRWQILGNLLKDAFSLKKEIKTTGFVEILKDRAAILVYPNDNYQVKPFSVYIAPALCQKYSIQRGHQVTCLSAKSIENDSVLVALEIVEIMGKNPENSNEVIPFTELVPYYPMERILLEYSDAPINDLISLRVFDLITPIGLGQRGLIVAPPRTGKTILLQGMANSISKNYPQAHLICLLVDERPEEVTDFKKSVHAEIVSSTFDENAENHVHAAEMVIEKARRMVEHGEDVIILLDSITRLARAYNTVMPSSGKILSGGVEANAMQKPKRFFGSARNIEGGGSLTIMGTALVETGSKMDEVIFEEFKGTGNMELHLDRALVEKRIYPSIQWEQSGTRKEELLYHPDERNKIYSLRRAMKGVASIDAMEMLIQKVKKTKSNAEFLMKL